MPSKSQSRVIEFLAKRGIPVRDKNTVVVKTDDSCEMAQVEVNDHLIMLGNNWDFHPECHGFDLPRFSGHTDLARVFQAALLGAGHEVKLVEDTTWEYQD